jgi:hypothetical protein
MAALCQRRPAPRYGANAKQDISLQNETVCYAVLRIWHRLFGWNFQSEMMAKKCEFSQNWPQ